MRSRPAAFIISGDRQEKPSEGEVIAIGPGGRDEGGKLIAIDVKVGDRVLFGKWSGWGRDGYRGVGVGGAKRPQ